MVTTILDYYQTRRRQDLSGYDLNIVYYLGNNIGKLDALGR
jgi:hypothetical protein